MTGTDDPERIPHPSTTPGMGPRVPQCPHTVDNGAGITWHCVLPPHDGTTPESHYMVVDELAVRRHG